MASRYLGFIKCFRESPPCQLESDSVSSSPPLMHMPDPFRPVELSFTKLLPRHCQNQWFKTGKRRPKSSDICSPRGVVLARPSDNISNAPFLDIDGVKLEPVIGIVVILDAEVM